LRAGHVAVFGGRFHYFCGTPCRAHYAREGGLPAEPDAATLPLPPVAVEADVGPAPHGKGMAAAAPVTPSGSIEAPVPSSRSDRRSKRGSALLDGIGVVSGALAPAMGLLGSIEDIVRLPLVAGAWSVLLLRLGRAKRDPSEPHPLVVAGPATLAVAAALWSQLARDPRSAGIAAMAGLCCAAGIVVERLVQGARVGLEDARSRIVAALDVGCRAVQGDETMTLRSSEVRPGEQVIVDAGEVVGVDAIVVGGEARVTPWLHASTEVIRREGDPIVAGARVVSSRLRLTTTWSGRERAWVKLLSAPATRIDVAAPTARALRLGVERVAPAAGMVAGIVAYAANAPPVEILALMAAMAAAAAKAIPSFVALHFGRAQIEALASGIVYKDARAFERAAATDVAVLCARGTVLLGEPEIVAIESIATTGRAADGVDAAEMAAVLSLAAGAETASAHPFAAAVLRAARSRGIRPDHVRNATARAGLGVTALTSSGERLVVGGRAIMLEEKIGVAVADARVTELEAQGRSVLLVAVGDRVVGLIALQDGLRAGARAAVQRLLDARIEPVLMSGEARDTCETIGHALDIDHVRPEILPGDRGPEVRALAEGGSVVSVIGHPASDDAALGAADVAVAMGAAGATPGEWAVALASDDVRHAADALAIPRATRARVWLTVAIGSAPSLCAVLTIALGIAPLAVAPLAALLGAIAAAVHARESGGRFSRAAVRVSGAVE
jgi:cation transport ATPase